MVLLVVVSAAIFGIGKSAPFKPSADASTATGGNVGNGATLFAANCAGCHGPEGAGGGIGPKLAGVPRDGAGIASVIAAGRGAMPAGLVGGTDAADVVAYVVSIGGGAAPPTTTAPTVPAVASGGTATFTGNRLVGLTVGLDDPAPEGWSIWVDGSASPRKIAPIDVGATVVVVKDAGLDSLVDGNDSVLVGASADAPALRADIPGGLSELLVSSAVSPDGASLLAANTGQVDVLLTHIGFLEKALAENNLANVRFHGEHMVNIAGGDPLADVDGNGEASNPGDGVGLVGRPDRLGYVPAIRRDGGDGVAAAKILQTLIRAVAVDGQRCGAAASVAEGRPCVTAIGGRAQEIAVAAASLETQARKKRTITLKSVP